jgi:hypothetical protein
MNKSAMTNKLDRSDRAILRELQADGRISNKALATKVHLSPPACHARMKRLTEEGYIRGYKPILDRRKLGLDNLCFIELSLEVHQQERIGEILDGVVSLPEVRFAIPMRCTDSYRGDWFRYPALPVYTPASYSRKSSLPVPSRWNSSQAPPHIPARA